MNHDELSELLACVEDVLVWDYLHLTTDCEDGQKLYRAIKRLEDCYYASVRLEDRFVLKDAIKRQIYLPKKGFTQTKNEGREL